MHASKPSSSVVRTLFARTLFALLVPLAVGCSGDGGTDVQQVTPTIGVSASPATLTLTQGQNGTATVTLTRGGNYADAVTLAVTGAPSNVNATLSPTSLSGGTLASTLTIAAAANAATGPATLTITASGSGVTSQTATVALTVNAATQTLTVARAGTGTGTVTSSPAGIDCGSTCSGSFNAGSTVTLTATAAAGSTFAGWSGACTNATGTCTVTMSAAQSVTATFNTAAPTTNTLTVSTSGTGTGSVTSAPAGITCPGTCSAPFTAGSTVTLTATAATGSTFGGWGGACSGTVATCTVTMSAAQTVTATFSQVAQTFALTVATAGTGTGSVTSSPAGITCPGACTNSYASGTVVTLTATPATGSTFAGWSGACTNATGTCAVTLSAAQSVTATFNTTAAASSFTMALSPAAVTVQAGATATGASTVTLTRTNFTGLVAVATSGAPNGLTVTPNPVSVTGNTTTLDVAATAAVTPGTYNVTVTGTGVGVTQQTATLAVTVTAPAQTGSFTLAVSPASVSVQQGASGTATVNVTRAGGFAGAVNLAVSGAPNGLTVTPNPASATGGTSALNIAATAATTPGTYTITVTGTGTGVAQQTATFTVQVTQQSSGGGNITYSFADCVPIWFAVQNGNGTWTRVTPSANNTFSFTIGANGGVAYVTQSGTSFTTTVSYGSGTEFGTITSAPIRCGGITPASGTKTLTGTTAGLSLTDLATVTIGGAIGSASGAAGGAFTIRNVPDGLQDLVASRGALNLQTFSTTLNKLIIRRNTNYPNNSAIPLLDFTSSEAFDPVQRTITVGNLGTDQTFTTVAFRTSNGASAAFFTGLGGGSSIPYYGVPAAQLQAADIHQIFLIASPSATSLTSFRAVYAFLHTPADVTLTLGPSLGATTVTSLGTTPYLRLRAQLPSASAYNAAATASYSQTGRTVNVTSTAGFSGSAPASWTLDIPDFSAAGYDPTWGLQTGAATNWTVTAVGGNFLALLGGTPADNTQILAAGASGSSNAFIQYLRSRGIQWMRKP